MPNLLMTWPSTWRRWWGAIVKLLTPITPGPHGFEVAERIERLVPVAPREPVREGCGCSVRLEKFTAHCEGGRLVADDLNLVCPSCLGVPRK